MKALILLISGRREVSYTAISPKLSTERGWTPNMLPMDHPGTEKPKLLQSSVAIKGPGPGEQQHGDAEAEVQFEDISPKASHALGNLTESGNRWICKGQGCRAAGAVNTNSDIRPLIHNERRALGAEAGTSPMLEDN